MNDDLVRIVRARIALGTMPSDLDQLLEQRGTLVGAASDLAIFVGATIDESLSCLTEVYGAQETAQVDAR